MTSEERSYQAYYEFADNAGERNFYEISTSEATVTIRCGRLGTQGGVERHSFESVAEARRYAAAQIEDARQRFSVERPTARGRNLAPPPPIPPPPPYIAPAFPHPATHPTTNVYAGFGERAAAKLIDWLIQGTLWFMTTVPLMLLLGKNAAKGSFLPFFMLLLISCLYSVYYESSPQQATPGKRALGIIVADLNGERLSWRKALARWAASSLSFAVTGGIGYLLAALTRRQQTLHDMLTGTLTYSKSEFLRLRQQENNQERLLETSSEKIALRAARERNGVLTAIALAADTPLSIEQAEQALNKLAQRGVCQMELSENGRVEYHFPDFLPE